MRKLLSVMLASTMMLSVVACGSEPATEVTGEEEVQKVKATCIVSSKSDKSFFESASNGMERAGVELADFFDVDVYEMGNDPTKYKDAMYSVADGDSDIIITGTYNMIEHVEEVAAVYPDKKFVIFDGLVNYESGFDNVLSIGYAANEGAFLAGVAAAKFTVSDHEKANEDKVVGFIGGVENNPVITDFLVGFVEGVQFVDSEIKVVTAYIGNYSDTAKGKELGFVQYDTNKADVIFTVCGGAATGVVEAALESDNAVIAVDVDQSVLYEGKDEQAVIMTSALKRIDNSLFSVLEDTANGVEVPYGTEITLGFEADSVGLVYNDLFTGYVGEEVIAELQALQEEIMNGTIKVSTSRELDLDAINAIVETAK